MSEKCNTHCANVTPSYSTPTPFLLFTAPSEPPRITGEPITYMYRTSVSPCLLSSLHTPPAPISPSTFDDPAAFTYPSSPCTTQQCAPPRGPSMDFFYDIWPRTYPLAR